MTTQQHEGSSFHWPVFLAISDMYKCSSARNLHKLHNKQSEKKISTLPQLVSLLRSSLCESPGICSTLLMLSIAWSSVGAGSCCFTRRGLTTSRRPRSIMSSSCDNAFCADSSASNSIIANKPCTANTGPSSHIQMSTYSNNVSK